MRGRRSARGRTGEERGIKGAGANVTMAESARYSRDEERKGWRGGGGWQQKRSSAGRATGGESWGRESRKKERKKEGNYARRDRQLPRNLTDRLTDSRNTRPARDVCAYSR